MCVEISALIGQIFRLVITGLSHYSAKGDYSGTTGDIPDKVTIQEWIKFSNKHLFLCFPVLSRTWWLLIIFCFVYLWGYPLARTHIVCLLIWPDCWKWHSSLINLKVLKTNPYFLQIFMMPTSQNCKRLTFFLNDNDGIIWIFHEYRLNSTFYKLLYKTLIFFSLIAVLWLSYGVSQGMSLPYKTNYHNFYLSTVYLSFSSDTCTHIVHINLSKCEAICFYLLLQKIRIHSLNFLYTKNRVSCFNKCLTIIFHSFFDTWSIRFFLAWFDFDCDFIYVCLWS